MLAPNEIYGKKKKIHIPVRDLAIPFIGVLSKKYAKWNKKWKAPFWGMVGFQGNNLIRYFEYPWAYYAVPLRKGMRALDFGGGLCGFQFVLSKKGLIVHNVDPGLGAKGIGWPVSEKSIGKLNRKFGTNVILHNCFIEKANLPSSYFDVIYSISVMEHLTGSELRHAMNEVRRILKPGGHFVMTTDLFPNVYPFTKAKRNQFGENVSVKKLVGISGLKMIFGKKSELYGFKEFDAERILRNLHKYLISNNYPALTQTVVLKKG